MVIKVGNVEIKLSSNIEYKYASQQKDGRVFLFMDKPTIIDTTFGGRHWFSHDKLISVKITTKENPNWENSLIEIKPMKFKLDILLNE